MPAFKPKVNKKITINKKSMITLDNKHSEILEKINKKETEELPRLIKKQQDLKKKLNSKSITIEASLEIKDTLKEISKKIKKIKKEKNEYLLNNSKYIFEYFERKKDISEGVSKVTVLNSFFNKESKEKTKEMTRDVEKYLENIDKSEFMCINNYITDIDVCSKCSGEMIPIEYEGIKVCNKCGLQNTFLVEHEKPSYKDPPTEVCFYAYKRINHFREILSQFQAKETTQIPDKVIEDIKNQIKKERIGLDELTTNKSKDILKKLGYNKYYEHIPFIKDKLGIKPPVMNPELEDKLCNLFMEIEKHYSKYCPSDRVNFLNYYYVLFKLCELLNERHFLPCFPMLKDPIKRIEQDIIWKEICKELNWKFIPTE
jgi:hypothetical protein